MWLGILSDTHNQLENLPPALNFFSKNKVDTLIHCGDATSVDVVEYLCEYQVIYVYGNGDFLSGEIRDTLKAFSDKNYAGMVFRGEISEKKIAVIHGHIPAELNKIIHSGEFDYVFTGHTHRRKDEWVGKTRVINPGALGGSFYQSRSVALLNLISGELFFQEIIGA